MRRRRVVSLLIACVCFVAQPILAASSADDEAVIRRALNDWVKNFNAQDYKAAATVWAPDLLGWGPLGSPDDTFEREIEAAKRPLSPSDPRTTFELTINEVLISGDLAVVRDTWTETTRAQGGSMSRKTFRSFEVWRRQADGKWKIARWIDGPETPVKS